jgi:phage terminase large subunit-like protein
LTTATVERPSPKKVAAWKGARPPVRARTRWKLIARKNQLAPAGRWFIWLILAGRGWGKTITGAQWAAEKARRYPGCRIALCAQTFADGRDTMVEGETGLLSVFEDAELRGGGRETAWNRSMGELYLANGSRFKVFSSEKPARLRGPQHHFAWADEPATFFDARKGPSKDTTWSNLEFGCRLTIDGSEPQIAATGTPQPVRLLTQADEEPFGLLHRKSTVITKGHTDENLKNLARTYREEVVEPFRGTRLGRQELAAEILEDTPGALWHRDWIEAGRVTRSPLKGYRAKVVALDPASGGEDGDEQATCLAGLGLDNDLYVAGSWGVRTTPLEWLKSAILLAHEEDAVIVVEKNHGGEFLVGLLEQAMRELGVRRPYLTVTASKGKFTRAEPVAMLYEQGYNTKRPVIHHIGEKGFPELEDQQCNFAGLPGEKSPDRLDALVWAMTYLMRFERNPKTMDERAIPYKEARGPEMAVAYR